MSEEVVGQWSTERGAAYKERLRLWISCLDCGVYLTVGYIMEHQRRMHGTEPEIDWNYLPFSHTEHLPHMFDVRFLKGISQCQCPFPG